MTEKGSGSLSSPISSLLVKGTVKQFKKNKFSIQNELGEQFLEEYVELYEGIH